MKEVLLGAMTEYLPTIERLPQHTTNSLLEGLRELRDIGVVDYGYRLIWRNGYSSMITTSKAWVEAFGSNIIPSMIEHMSEEALQVQRNNLTVITRSSDKLTNEYLRALDYLGLNNSLVRYHFYEDYIGITYYVGQRNDHFIRDVFFNKMTLLEKAEQKMVAAFVEIKASKRFHEQQELLINPQIINSLIGKRLPLLHNHSTEVDEECLLKVFNYKELAYLTLLRFECSNKYLARYFKVSESTVKHDIASLKVKLCIENREGLIDFANRPKIIQLTKGMRLI